MDKIRQALKEIKGLDAGLIKKAQSRLDSLTKPQGSLGILEELARQIAAISGTLNPSLNHKVIFTLAADHGVNAEKISAYPKEVTAQMVYNFLRGGAGINVLAKHVGSEVIVVDMGVAEKISAAGGPKNFKDKKIALGTKNMAKGPAMTRDEAIKSIEAGMEIFEEEYGRGIDIVGTGDMGIGNTTASSAIAAAICGVPVENVVGRGTGLDDQGLLHKIEIIKQALKANKPNPDDAIDVLSKVGGFEIGGLAGIILACAARSVPVVIDGFISGASALIAYKLSPKVKEYIVAGHCSVEKGHKIILDYIGLKPLLNLEMRLGEGTGAALGIGIAEAAVKILTQMATFQEAGVSEKG
jgi:nicotinate-nucleotide--dimethylbenzimidazole phosphoribosyltransferase